LRLVDAAEAASFASSQDGSAHHALSILAAD
jgi:hypothetical protein